MHNHFDVTCRQMKDASRDGSPWSTFMCFYGFKLQRVVNQTLTAHFAFIHLNLQI